MNPDPLTAELLANGPFARDDAPFRLIEVAGAQAGEFLQRLCTQDVVGLADGAVAPAAFLDSKGKLVATCLVFRLGESFWLETQQEQAERLAALLERYHFNEKLTMQHRAQWPCQELVLPAAEPLLARAEQAPPGKQGVAVWFARRGVQFWRMHGVPGHRFAVVGSEDDKEYHPQDLTPDLAECLRMGAGLVRVGLETEPTTLALEADLDDHCSTTKGCYTGQEIVARIHTYGHVNRKLCLLHLAAGPAITAPQSLHELDDQLAVGRVMHAVPVPGKPVRVGLGYLPTDFQGLHTKLALADGSAVTVAGFGAPA